MKSFKTFLEGTESDVKRYMSLWAGNSDNRPFNIFRFFIKHAKRYYPELEMGKKPLKNKNCYRNAFNKISKGYKYVEGIVLVHGVPISHAWNSKGNKSIDCTLDPTEDYINQKYVGLEIPTKVVIKAMTHKNWTIASGVLGMIAMMDDAELLEVQKQLEKLHGK